MCTIRRLAKKLLGAAFVVEEENSLSTLDFVSHRSVQHVSSEWHEEYCTRYHSHLLSKNCDQSDELSSGFPER